MEENLQSDEINIKPNLVHAFSTLLKMPQPDSKRVYLDFPYPRFDDELSSSNKMSDEDLREELKIFVNLQI